jgi:uncharacterized protein
VWDHLHHYNVKTPIDDLDVVYFDKGDLRKENEKRFEDQLKNHIPNLNWSVKNQARMHIWNNESSYEDLFDAIAKWPETATAIIMRMDEDNEIEIIAPHGLSDLFRLLVVPTQHFQNNLKRYRERIEQKRWKENWPNLRIIEYLEG